MPTPKKPASSSSRKAAAKPSASDKAFEKAKKGLAVPRESVPTGIENTYQRRSANMANNDRNLSELNRRSSTRRDSDIVPTSKKISPDAKNSVATGYMTKDEIKAWDQSYDAYHDNRYFDTRKVGPKIVGPKSVGPKKPPKK